MDIKTEALYDGFKIRFANLTHRLDLAKEKVDVCVESVCDFLTKKLPIISELLNNGQFDTGSVKKCNGSLGNYIEFPNLQFTVPKSDLNLTAIIRINPCFLNIKGNDSNHYSKIWINLFNSNYSEFKSNEIVSILDEAKYWCTVLSKAVTEFYIKTCENYGKLVNENKQEKHWISIDTLSLLPGDDVENFEAWYDPLFLTNNDSNIIKRFRENPVAEQVLKNIASCLSKSHVDDILERLDDFKNITWKVRKDNEAKAFYGQKSTEDCFHIVAAAVNSESGQTRNINNIDKLFRSTVAGLIAEL